MGCRKFVLDSKSGYWGLATPSEVNSLYSKICLRGAPEKYYEGVQVVALNTTEGCNLGCIYCSTKERRSGRKMSPEIAKRTIDCLDDLASSPDIVFHGSEPLLNMSLIREAVAYGERRSGQTKRPVSFTVQSNLTLLNKEIIDFFNEHRVGISTSLDGRERENNANRPYRNGLRSYMDVIRGVKKVLEFQKDLCAVCVVTKNNVHSLHEISLDFERIGITEVNFLPAVGPTGNEDYLPSNRDLSESYITLFEEAFKRFEKNHAGISVRTIPQYLSSLFVVSGVDSCRICTPSPQHPLLAVDIDGEIYPCDFFWGKKDKSLGNIMDTSFESILNSPKNFRKNSIEFSVCGNCDWKKVCGGGCAGDRILSGQKPYYCETHRTVYEYLSNRIEDLLEKGVVRKIFDMELKRNRLRRRPPKV